jgi:hypothetical protein
MFSVRYELNLYILFRVNSVFGICTAEASTFLKASRFVREQNVVVSPEGLRTKNHCAGEVRKASQDLLYPDLTIRGLNCVVFIGELG